MEIFDASRLNLARMPSFDALDKLRLSQTYVDSLKMIDTTMLQVPSARLAKALESIKFDSMLTRSLKAIEGLASIPSFGGLKSYQLDPVWSRSVKALAALQLAPSLLPPSILDGLHLGKVHDLVGTWHASNPFDEIKDVMDALRSGGLADAALNLSEHSTFQNEDIETSFRTGRSVSENAETVSISDVQAIVDRVINEATDQSTARLTPLIVAIANEVSAMRNSRLKEIFLAVIVPILITAVFAILNPIADFYVKRALETPNSTSPREIKKSIRKRAPLHVDSRDELEPYRFVSHRALKVHTHASSQSPTIGYLNLGQVVILLEKRKAWSLVAWRSNEDSPSFRGWVFTRYVNKIT